MYNNMGMAVKVLGCLALPGRCEQDGERSTGGDPDDTSYIGHPKCEFCEEQYLDKALYIHLRTNHFWCHFCAKRGSQEYYPRYPELRQRFRHSHILCEEGSCVNEKCSSVFDNKLDYQAHCAKARTAQGKNASLQQSQLNPGILFTQPSGLVQASYERGGGGG